ncbi:hypothetical protein DH2020_034796 [Rehmannia glutinosa]|uniref:Uncharacterized protein n=1 Tax=Rehmannia glutinosa TaxID=99300 RepID=A0ABR0VC07_REHGL
MIMDVEIISVERIKPSIPTPNHLKEFNLSILDHLIPAAYAPIVVFYPNQNDANHFEILEKLKKSLSETLSRFFPLAGTIKDDFTIDCDDQGACFTIAKVKNCLLSEFLETPDLKMIAKFLPCGLTSNGTNCVTNIQASEFECGGISIGVCISHRILDGVALSTFLKSWADFAREKRSSCPIFLHSLLSLPMARGLKMHRWRCGVLCSRKGVLKCVSKIDGEFVKKIRGDEGSETMHKCLKEIEEFGCKDVDHFGFTSWCNLGFYDVDFGFGKPVWVSSIDASGPFFMNLAILIDRRCGDGIEAWVTLDEQEMAILESNQEFQTCASLNQSPLKIGNGDA